MQDRNYTIQNVINYINVIKKQQCNVKGVCILLGAGADITSGGKTFRELKMDLLEANGIDITRNITDKNLTEKFDDLIEKFTQDDRSIELESIMEKICVPSEGYELLVFLAHLGYIDAVISTNFDVLLEQTEQELSVKPFDIFAPGRAIPGNYYEKRQVYAPVYVKLHGDLYGRLVTHLTKKEIESKQYGSEFLEMVTNIIKNYAVIAIGYGGYDDLLTDIFKDCIESIQPVYWCNIAEPSPDSQLVQVLNQQDKLRFLPCTFDAFFQELGLYFLKKQELHDTNPHFLPTIIKAKVLNQKVLYNNTINNKTCLIERSEIENQILNFVVNVEKNAVMLVGNAGMGKTTAIHCFIDHYSDFFIMPIYMKKREQDGILKSLANAMGYKTDVPFSLLYNFANWCEQNQFSITFVIDEIYLGDNVEDSVKYVKELFDFLKIISDCNCIKVILCINEGDYKKLSQKLEGSFYQKYIDTKICVQKFTCEEMKMLLKDNQVDLDQESYELLREPYMWGLVNNSKLNRYQSLDDCIGKYVESVILANNELGLTQPSLQIILEKIACASIQSQKLEIPANILCHLQDCNIVEENGHFTYDKYTEYYYYKYIVRKSDVAKYIFYDLCNPDYLQQKPVLKACIRALSDINTIAKLEQNLEAMAIYLNRNTKQDPYGVIMVMDSIKRIQQQKYNFMIDYLDNICLQKSNIRSIFDIFCFTAIYASEDPYKLLNLMNDFSQLAYNAFIVKEDYNYNKLRDAIQKKDLKFYKDFLKKRYRGQTPQANFLEFLYLLTSFGPDNISSSYYEQLVTVFQEIFEEYLKNCNCESAYNMVASKVKLYSYNILFNSGSDVEEKFYQAIHNNDLRSLYEKISKGAVLSIDEYLCLIEKAIDINNAWSFISCNFIVALSMQNDFDSTYSVMQDVLGKLDSRDIVKKLDFYLSSVFMSLYICQEQVFEHFNDIFAKVVDKYEVQLFNKPETRLSTLQKFKDEFEMNFEDGFNPLAFYFYVAPSRCYTQGECWNDGTEYLQNYWTLLEHCEQSGNYNEMLRIVHALGQMISIYPTEGYASLEKMAQYSHVIIRQGVIRILKENYLRYPLQTQHFIQHTHFDFSKEELLDIQSNRDPKWCNRTLEQLHWCRFFVNLSNIFAKKSLNIFMKQFYETDSYSSFIFAFFNQLFQ